MKVSTLQAYGAVQVVVVSFVLAQNVASGTQTITVSGQTITVGGTNAATVTLGTNTIVVNGGSSTTSAAASQAASGDDDAGGDYNNEPEDEDDYDADNEDDNGDTDGASISGYTHTPTTLTYGSSKIVLSASAQADDVSSVSAGISNSANGTSGVQPTSGGGSGGDNGGSGDDGSSSGGITPAPTATAIPSGPTSSLDAIPTGHHRHSGAATLQFAGSLLAVVGAAMAWVL